MDTLISHTFSVFMGFFAIMNPIANTPVFFGLTANSPPAVRRKVAAKALIVSFVIVVIFSAAGKPIFELFGITLPSFRIMGGILVALVGYNMLHGGEHSPVQHPTRTRMTNKKAWMPKWMLRSRRWPCRSSPGPGPLQLP